MTIDTLKQIVKDALKDKLFSLDLTTLQSPSVAEMAVDNVPKNTLQVTAADKDPIVEPPDGKSIIVNGTGIDLPFKDMTIQAIFYLVGSNAALYITAAGKSCWKMSDSFPVFATTIGASLSFTGTPMLYLLSDPKDDKAAGLSFDGTIDFSGMNVGISSLLGISDQRITGAIKLKNGGRGFEMLDLEGPAITNVNLWVASGVSVQFRMGSRLLPNPATKTTAVLPYIELNGSIPFSDTIIPISVQVISLQRPIRFSVYHLGGVLSSLKALSALVNGTALGGLLPPPDQFPVEEILKFTSFFIDFDVTGKSVAGVGMRVNSIAPWTIAKLKTGKVLSAVNIQLDFYVVAPFSNPAAYLNLQGDVQLTGTSWMHIAASYPSFMVTGALTDSSTLSIEDFIEQFAGPSPSVPEMYVTQLGFSLQSENYSFALMLDGTWPINGNQSLLLTVRELGFSADYADGDVAAKFTGIITVASVDLYLTADYASEDTTSGWKFTGQTGKGQKIEIGRFITYLTKTFGIGAPPKWIEGTTLQDLSITLDTIDKNFEFSIKGNIPVAASNALQIELGFKMISGEGGYTKTLTGVLNSTFTLIFSSSPSDTSISAQWVAAGPDHYLQFADIAAAFGFSGVPPVPPGLNLELKSAGLFYDFTSGSEALVISAASAHYGKAVFVAKKIDSIWTYVFGVNVSLDNTSINLERLPLIGKDLTAAVGQIGLDNFRIVVATKAIAAADEKAINKLIADHAGSGYPFVPEIEEGVQPGAYAAIELALGKDNTYTVQVSTASKPGAKSGAPLPGTPAADSSDEDSSAYWVKLQKSIGPVYFDKAGVAYNDGKITLMLNASLVFTALSVDLTELAVTNPINAITPCFGLSGLGISYQSGAVQISGSFLAHNTDAGKEYLGSAVIALNAFNLSAMGAYASVDSHTSLFIFALLTQPPLGGPPAFFITGVAAGFGYNRGLKLPDIDHVANFPLVCGFVPGKTSPFSGSDPNAALAVMMENDVVPVAIGENWLAAGVQFTSFELIQSFALLVLKFGTDLEVGMLGMSTISVPSKEPVPVAYAQLAIDVSILPDKGILAVDARLTPASYVLDKKCYLTGGFAFYVWTSPHEQAGDFVVTLGGYHPDFPRPGHYPIVPRLGFNWVVTDEVTIKGGLYFALTPTCLMAGGSLEATFQSDNLKAWFTIGADFLIAWKPYRYQAHMYISFGVSYTFSLDLLFTTITETISVSLGADLTVWGPDFSGIARIHLWIISFDISFGSAPADADLAISWQDFKHSFLPPVSSSESIHRKRAFMDIDGDNQPTDTYCSSKVLKGLIRDLSQNVQNDDFDGINWIVNRNLTILETQSLFPSKEYSIEIKDSNCNKVPKDNIIITNIDALNERNKEFGVGMVNLENDDFTSEQSITLTFDGIWDETFLKAVKYEVTAILGNVPKALWEKRAVGFSKDATITNVLTGFDFMPLAPTPDSSRPIGLENFQYRSQTFDRKGIPSQPDVISGPAQDDAMNKMMSTINIDPAATNRKNILNALSTRGVVVDTDVDVAAIAKNGNDFILAPPVLAYTYWKAS